jgi:hypothetical protein
MAFLPGNCTYRFSESWTSGNRPMHAKHARFRGDSGCGGSTTCASSAGTSLSNNHCGEASDRTPYRSQDGGRYFILLKYQTAGASFSINPGTRDFRFYGASITNNQSGAILSMSCSCPTGGTSCFGSAMREDSCYQYQIACYHDYLNNSIFATRYPWNENCQPCY